MAKTQWEGKGGGDTGQVARGRPADGLGTLPKGEPQRLKIILDSSHMPTEGAWVLGKAPPGMTQHLTSI